MIEIAGNIDERAHGVTGEDVFVMTVMCDGMGRALLDAVIRTHSEGGLAMLMPQETGHEIVAAVTVLGGLADSLSVGTKDGRSVSVEELRNQDDEQVVEQRRRAVDGYRAEMSNQRTAQHHPGGMFGHREHRPLNDRASFDLAQDGN